LWRWCRPDTDTDDGTVADTSQCTRSDTSGCGFTDSSGRCHADRRPAGNPFKIGVVVAQTGNLASSGRRLIEGMQLALDELGNTAAGRQLQLLPADSAGNPDQAKTHVRRLVESDKVDVITGFTITSELTAVRDYLHEQKQVAIGSIAGWPPLTRDPKVRSPYIFRSSFCQGQYEFIRAK
jgi:branched-chain amino acid transport system substrate-binding protein